MSISISFLEQGFDSLSLTQIASKISKEFNVTITFAQLMESLTNIELLTRYLEPYLAQSAEEIESGVMKDSADISLLSQKTYDGSNEGELAVIIKEIQKLSVNVSASAEELGHCVVAPDGSSSGAPCTADDECTGGVCDTATMAKPSRLNSKSSTLSKSSCSKIWWRG